MRIRVIPCRVVSIVCRLREYPTEASILNSRGGSGIRPPPGDTVVAEIPVPYQFIGRTIRELNVRQAFDGDISHSQ